MQVVEGDPWVKSFLIDGIFGSVQHCHFINLQNFQELHFKLHNSLLRWLVLQVVLGINNNNLTALFITDVLTIWNLVTPTMGDFNHFADEINGNSYLFVIGIQDPSSQVKDDELQGDMLRRTLSGFW